MACKTVNLLQEEAVMTEELLRDEIFEKNRYAYMLHVATLAFKIKNLCLLVGYGDMHLLIEETTFGFSITADSPHKYDKDNSPFSYSLTENSSGKETMNMISDMETRIDNLQFDIAEQQRKKEIGKSAKEKLATLSKEEREYLYEANILSKNILTK